METEEKTIQDDALIMVLLRNEFYKQKYHLILGVYGLSMVVVAILVGMLVYLHKHPQEPYYFPADDVSRLIKDIPLTQPNMSLDDVIAWTIEGVQEAYSYDYVNYRAELQNAQKYFSPYGWYKYMQGLDKSNNLLALTQRKMIFNAKVVDKPKVTGEGILKTGSYGYKFEMPLLVTYMVPPYDDKSSFQNALILTVVVQRQNMLTSYKGLGIMQLNATVATSTSGPQELTTPPPS